jgi:7,8-dihydroneopterin aldolase/epimerase/oxygenase
MNISKITIVDLEVFVHVGVSDEERATAQRLLITVDMDYDFSSAALSDRLTKTIDYHQVVQHLLAFGRGRSWKLIEKLVTEVADTVLSDFKPLSVFVEVKKFPFPQARYVSVSLAKTAAANTPLTRAGWGIR